MSSCIAYGMTDLGSSRLRNEDRFSIEREAGLFIVADGMGGHRHGEVASELTVEEIRRHLGVSPPREDMGERLDAAVRSAHDRLVQAIREDPSLSGMGTTVVVMLLDGETALIGHVGDSRAYRLREDRLELLTEDHTWVNEQVAAGVLSTSQARNHPLRNVVTRAVGGGGEVVVDVQRVRTRPGELYLLCSDGLTGMLSDAEIAATLRRETSLDERCRDLVRLANERGGLDNITVVLLAFQESSDPDDA